MILLIKLISVDFRNKHRSKWNEVKTNVQITFGKLKRLFVRPKFPNIDNYGINLHLGCGSINHPIFINIDGLPDKHIHYVRNLDDLTIFKDNSVNLIYASHCLEHFPHHKIPEVLDEWFRVLKNGGILRLAVPNFDSLVNIYQQNNFDTQSIQAFLMGGQDYKYNFHMAIFNGMSLEALLKNAGFKIIREWQHENNQITNFDDCSKAMLTINQKSYCISMNIEAIK